MENDKLVRLSDVIEIVECQCSDGHMWGDDNITLIDASNTIDALSDIPAVDAEPVVRCKDCKWGKETCGNIECYVDLNAPPDYHGYDWYCPNGEKVTE